MSEQSPQPTLVTTGVGSSIVLATPEAIDFARLAAFRYRMDLERKGIEFSRVNGMTTLQLFNKAFDKSFKRRDAAIAWAAEEIERRIEQRREAARAARKPSGEGN